MADKETKDKLITAESLKALHDYAEGTYATKEAVTSAVSSINSTIDTKVTEAKGEFSSELSAYQETVDADLEEIHQTIDDLPTTLESDYYTKTATDEAISSAISTLDSKYGSYDSRITANADNISTFTGTVSELAADVDDLKKEFEENKGNTYDISYNEDTNILSLYENPVYTEEGDLDPANTAKTAIKVSGGGGGGSTGATLTVTRIGSSSVIERIGATVTLGFLYSSKEDDGSESPTPGTAIWKVSGSTIATTNATAGENYLDVTQYLSLTTQTVSVTVTDPSGNTITRTWSVQIVDVRLTTTFNDQYTYAAGSQVSISYTAYGAVEKTIHFKHNGQEIGSVVSTTSGIPATFVLPAHTHGSYLIEMYLTATIGSSDIETDHIFKDIMYYNESEENPVIGASLQTFTAKQYDTTAIRYYVYDPKNETPQVNISVYLGESQVSSSDIAMTSNAGIWNFKASSVGEYTIKITCRGVEKVLHATIAEIGIQVAVAEGYIFDFEPTGYSNNNTATRLWTNDQVHMSVSDNFDWTNGGYQTDENGDQYFCVKAGTTASFDYNLFADDARRYGKNFKVIYKVTNVKKIDTTFLSCLNGPGIEMKPHETYIYSSTDNLYIPLSEEDIIEFEFNIRPYVENPTDISQIPMCLTYEDGVPGRPMLYDSSSSFTQSTPAPITIGSSDCDVLIYRMRAYESSLTNTNIKDNFIADARNGEEMVSRYTRNQIYDEYGNLTPESVAAACPALRVIKLETPYFTYDKENKVDGGKIEVIYKGTANDDEETIRQNNYTATGVTTNGQGTSSNGYKASGQNIDIRLNNKSSVTKTYTSNVLVYTEDSEEVPVGTKLDATSSYYNTDHVKIEDLTTVCDVTEKVTVGTKITLSDGTVVSKVALTSTSVPANYFNLKVNIASSENANNACGQGRYNRYMPYETLAKQNDSRVKNGMEFHNCVLFVKETNTDISTHYQFPDNDWHFYAMGNIGDSKKTDSSRMNDPDDKKEFAVEIIDWDKPLSFFPSDARSILIAENDPMIDGETFKMPDGTDVVSSYDLRYGAKPCEEKDAAVVDGEKLKDENGLYFKSQSDLDAYKTNIAVWRNFYKFITRDLTTGGIQDQTKVAAWKTEFENWFVLDSALYWYLFTLRYTMVDNRAKNTFWHYGKCPDGKYRFDFLAYDFDTSIGINNAGKLTMSYGTEDSDVDGSGSYYFRGAVSTFFTRIRDLFSSELNAMYQTCEASNCWSAESLINEYDSWQSEFPEELWRLDFERKYERPYIGTYKFGKDEQFLRDMANGKKKYQRRQFERDQEIYMASKFLGKKAQNDAITLRCTSPQGVSVAPSYKMNIIPYSNMYLTVFNGDTMVSHVRATAGQSYEVVISENSSANIDFVYVYSASRIQSMGDMSKLYLYYCSVGSAEKLQELIIGNAAAGYTNPSLTSLGLGSNKLLEKIDIRNVPNLTGSLNLANIPHVKELYAEGSGIQGVTFANGGELEIAHLPAITSLTAKNLTSITDLSLASLSKLTSFVIENTPAINTYEYVMGAPLLNYLRLIGIAWGESYGIQNTTVFEKMSKMRGIDGNGYNTENSVVTGSAYVSVIRQQKLADFTELWTGLVLSYGTVIPTYTAKFVNYDGSVLDIQYVDTGSVAADPTTRTEDPIAVPTKPNTQSSVFTFTGWDKKLTNLFGDETYTAEFKEETRTYRIRYISKGVVLQDKTKKYGEISFYEGDIPTYTAEESGYNFYLFKEWDKSGYVDGDKDINAVFDTCAYSDAHFEGKDISTMSPVEIYTLVKVGQESSYVELRDEIQIEMGTDYSFSDIEEHVIVDGETAFDGTNYIDTGLDLMRIDRDFTFVIDYKFLSGTGSNTVLAECYQADGQNGFRLWNTNSPRLSYGTAYIAGANADNRDILVIRHCKGDDFVHVYAGNLPAQTISYTTLSNSRTKITNSTLVLGAAKPEEGIYEQYAKGIIYWCKVWYGDLGDTACRNLVGWTHESVQLEMYGFRRYYLSDGSGKRCAMSFIAKDLLANKMKLTSTGTNSGGWAAAKLNEILNSRFYNAISPQWKALLRQVKIISSIGNRSTATSSSDCYIAIPSVNELCPAEYDKEPYNMEGTGIPWMTSNAARARKRIGDEKCSEYWMRSPSAVYDNYWGMVYGGNQYNADGAIYMYSNGNYEKGICIILSM